MAEGKVRWGVLGTAHIADALVRAFKLAGNCELTAVASRNLAVAQAWAAGRDVPNAFGNYEEMLASDAIDAVYTPVPNALHGEWSIKAMRQGKHVLCEKPLGSSAAEVREMMAVAEATGVKLMEAFMYRFHPATARLVDLATNGTIGTPKVIRATFGFLLAKPEDIRWSAELAGGSLMDVGCYCVNVARLLAGAEPLAVTASATWAATGVDESLVGTLEFPGGLLATVDSSFSLGTAMQQTVTVSGTEGRLLVNQPFRRGDQPVDIVVDKADSGDFASRKETVQVPGAAQYALMAEHFADAVLNNGPLAYSLQDSLGNMQVIEALLESARTGRRVELLG
ncbi:MAG TPA: Gfo/Idh/MocA family oxidoreductase [Chloroflexia bacterium]|nr:Gfo/Idh/MocA family oxidoreductase [Chloroflexia bacterium]